MAPFIWQNCSADVYAGQHSRAIRGYLDDVILPSIAALQSQVDTLSTSSDPIDAFSHSDTLDILSETKRTFALSVQSIFERQLRSYLKGCAEELISSDRKAAKLEKANWLNLRSAFLELRGINLESFPSFADLDLLHHLGNACRHGEGGSARKIEKLRPEWWPNVIPMPNEPNLARSPSVSSMEIPVVELKLLVEAVLSFWEDTTYIYHESINVKHPSLVRKLEKERIERAWLPQQNDHVANIDTPQ